MTDELLKALALSGHKTATLAPEAGTERLRRVINKGWSDDELLEAAERTIRAGLLNVRLYIMLGLPSETVEDVDGIIGLAMRMRAVMDRESRPLGRTGTLTLSVTPFIPKPFTPFQWAAMVPRKELEARYVRLRRALGPAGGIRLALEPSRESWWQVILGRGDRSVWRLLLHCLDAGGYKKRAIKRWGRDADEFVHRVYDPTEQLPWDFLKGVVDKQFLQRELVRAMREQITPPCRPGNCRACDACGPGAVSSKAPGTDALDAVKRWLRPLPFKVGGPRPALPGSVSLHEDDVSS